MDYKELAKHQAQSVNRIYNLVDELALVGESTDLEYVSEATKRIARAIEVEIEGIDEAVKEYHGI